MSERGEDRGARGENAESNPYESPQAHEAEDDYYGRQLFWSRLQLWRPVLIAAAVPVVLNAMTCSLAFDVETFEERVQKFFKLLPAALFVSLIFSISATGFVLDRIRRQARRRSEHKLREIVERH